jgi:hypothetical protein
MSKRTALPPRTAVRRPGRRSVLSPLGASPLRDSAGFSPASLPCAIPVQHSQCSTKTNGTLNRQPRPCQDMRLIKEAQNGALAHPEPSSWRGDSDRLNHPAISDVLGHPWMRAAGRRQACRGSRTYPCAQIGILGATVVVATGCRGWLPSLDQHGQLQTQRVDHWSMGPRIAVGFGGMAGCSATSQAHKLGLKPGSRVALIAVPDGWALTDPPPIERARDEADVDIRFVRGDLRRPRRPRRRGDLVRGPARRPGTAATSTRTRSGTPS